MCKNMGQLSDSLTVLFKELSFQLTLEALERLINMVDETKQIPCIFTSFDRISRGLMGQHDVLEDISRANKKEGYQRVRKVCAFPFWTRVYAGKLLLEIIGPASSLLVDVISFSGGFCQKHVQ